MLTSQIARVSLTSKQMHSLNKIYLAQFKGRGFHGGLLEELYKPFKMGGSTY